MSQRLPITVRLSQFEGPLDLLLHLIQTHEMDISSVSVTAITDQYLAYIRYFQELNFDIASEFMVMAATLIHWKSKALLPKIEDEASAEAQDGTDLSPEALARRLLERKRFLEISDELFQLPYLGADTFKRANKRPPIERIWKEMSATGLALSYQQMLVTARKRTQVLKKETVSVADKILDFADKLEVGKPSEMRSLVSALAERPEWVVTFLTSLELARIKKLKVLQEATYSPIWLELLENLKGFKPGIDYKIETFEKEIEKSHEQSV